LRVLLFSIFAEGHALSISGGSTNDKCVVLERYYHLAYSPIPSIKKPAIRRNE